MINKKLKEYKKFIKSNFELLVKILLMKQDLFIIIIKKKISKKGIYGTASKEEIKELKEEGIETDTIPWIEDKNN